jgi:carboxyl-terminal processing protease
MKDVFSYEEIGERFDKFALPWDQLNTTAFTALNKGVSPSLVKNSLARMAQNKNYQLLLESAQWKEQLDKEEKVTLNMKDFEALMKTRKDQIEKYKTLLKYNNGLKFTLHTDEINRGKTDDVFAKKSDNWMKNLKRDLYLQETVNIISELK